MVHSAVEEIGIFHNLVAGDAFDMSDKANATCIALEARVVQPLLLWEPYTLIDSLGHTDLFVSVLFAAIYCFSLLSARVMLQRASSRCFTI